MSSTKFVARHGINSLGDLIVTGSITATGGISISGSITSASFAVSASQAQNATSSSFALTASYASNVPLTASFAISASQATNSVSSSFALTASFAENAGGGAGFPYSGSAVITGSLQITNLTGSGVRYVVTDSDGNVTAQQASASILSTQTVTASAGQTLFNITNGYTTGLVNVFVNGTKLNNSEYIDTNGTSITFLTASMLNDVVEFQRYFPASGVTNNALRSVNYFTAVASQSVFSASYTPGLLDVFYNGSKLSNTDYTANNGSAITLATASAAGDIIEIDVYSYQVGAFSGIGGEGTPGQISYFNTSNAITGSPNFKISGSTMTVTGSLLVSGSGTFTNIGPAVFSGSIVSTGGFTGSFSGTATNAVSASQAQNSNNAVSSSFATTSLTSSFANNLTVAGTITAQTLNVQQVTSSVVYSSGSNVFGNNLSNTQVMTGSVSMTGSLSVNGALSGTSATFSSALTLNAANNQIRSGNELRFYRTDNAIYTKIYDAGSLAANGFTLDNMNAEGFHFKNNGTTVMRMNSSNNVGIGTTSPSNKLDVIGNMLVQGTQGFNATGETASIYIGDTASEIRAVYDGGLDFYQNTTFRMRIQGGTGNVGIGVVPSPSSVVAPILQIGTGGAFIGAQGSANILRAGSNAYYDGSTWRYVNSAAASWYEAVDGEFRFINAPSGTAGAALTTTERMRITSSGNVGIGTTNPGSFKLWVNGSTLIDGTLQMDSGVLNTPKTIAFNANSSAGGNLGSIDWYNVQWDGFIRAQIKGETDTGLNNGRLVFSTGAGGVTERMRITSGGTVYINATSNPLNNATPLLGILAGANTDAVNIKHTQNGNNTLNIWQTGASTFRAIAFYKGDTQTAVGEIACSTTSTTYTTTSDYRLKTNIRTLENGLDRVLQLKPSKFNWTTTGEETEGFIAHEVQEIFPDAVTGEKDAVYSSTGNIKPQSVDYGRITPLLVKAIQELKAENDTLKEILQRNNII